MKKFKTFVLNKITGLFFLIIFFFCSISLLSRSTNDPYFGSFTTSQNVNNFFGSVGSYFAGTAYTFIGISSLFIPIFFLVFGFKKTFGIKTHYVLIRLVSFFFGIMISSIIFNYWLFNGGILGESLIKVFNNVTYNGEKGSKESGKMRPEGKDYKVRDGDIFHFRFNI